MNFKNLFKEDNSKKKVFLYAREPVGAGQIFRDRGDYIIRRFLKVSNYKILSDYPDKTDLYIDLKKIKLSSISHEEFEIIEEVLDIGLIIKNERIFRFGMNYNDALTLILKCSKYLLDFFKKEKPEIIVINVIDTYILDILTCLARYFRVTIIPNCANSFDKNYAMITERGEYNYVQDPNPEAAQKFYELLKDRHNRPYVFNKPAVYKSVAKDYIKYKVKYLYHYLYKHKLLGKLDYRYIATKTAVYPRGLLNIIRTNKFFDTDLESLGPKSKNVYIPLHRHPECSTEYFIRNDRYLTYYNSLLKVIRFYSEKGFNVVLKEHTSMVFYRDVNYYKSMLEIKNVSLMSPFLNTYDLLEKCCLTALWTGSTGVEAIMNDNDVVMTETEIYFSDNKIAYYNSDEKIKAWSDEEKRQFSDRILSCFLPLHDK